MKFSAIAGKEKEKSLLIQSVQRNRIPHAQLFLAREGSGGLAMALALISYLMCENKGEKDSCGQCGPCLKTTKFIHPDVHFSFPVVKFGDKKRADTTSDDFLPVWRQMLAENPYMGTREWLQAMQADSSLPNINVKECNDIMHKLSMMSYESDIKILLMWLPEYLGNEGNRLLKLIEEPTENTYLILVTENQDVILQTILSRCQLVKIPPFEVAEIKRHLTDQLQIDEASALQIANLSDGNLNLAIAIGKNEAPDYSDLLISWLRTAYKGDPVEINQWIQVLSGLSKDDQKNFLEYGLHFFRQINLQQVLKGSHELSQLTKKEREIADRMSNLLDLDKITEISEILNEAAENIGRNANIKIMLFADTLTIGSLLKKK